MALPALPVVLKSLPKLLPAAKFAYDHRDKAVSLYKNIQKWRHKDTEAEAEALEEATLTPEQQIAELRNQLETRDNIIAEQSEIVAKLADDLSQLSHLTEQLRKRSQWHTRVCMLMLVLVVFCALALTITAF